MAPTIVFDALGTLLSFDGPANQLFKLFPSLGPDGFSRYFPFVLRDYMASSYSGDYRPLSHFFRHCLPRFLITQGLPVDDEAKENIESFMRFFARGMEPVEGAQEALELLISKGWLVSIVTNGGRSTVENALKNGSILQHFDSGKAILSCEEIGAAKTDPRVYQAIKIHLKKTYQLEENEPFWFVAGHAWDCQAARNCGFLTAFCEAYEEPIWNDAWSPPQVLATEDAIGVGLLGAVQAAIAVEESKTIK
ncbi:hypothetical protein SmJEL517_g03956 [Synchytrium microbalum]|uniref:Haloacid dehalogenase, type II n=1 Tax=Synchytrium microbalum TaxID=1806994 RepID=A0A507C6L8_9FUNG|nr:uncharacterized protein SmJEL517_g03956 [Synchytrium microbalum]TPX33125.1 hypothetical protein SmJEL517_g03956 [Synchytrium microbalum]